MAWGVKQVLVDMLPPCTEEADLVIGRPAADGEFGHDGAVAGSGEGKKMAARRCWSCHGAMAEVTKGDVTVGMKQEGMVGSHMA